MVAAVTSGQVDATIAIASMAKPLAASGQAHILVWAGDLVPYQITAVFTTPAMIANHPDVLRHFATAYQRGIADYRAAFLRLDQGHPVVDAATEAAIPLLNKYVFAGDPAARRKILDGVGYYDAGGALDVADVLDQLRWFRAQGLVKGDIDPAAMIDTRFLPTR
jgi:NitT/TauT family transport system substrate-binding protein